MIRKMSIMNKLAALPIKGVNVFKQEGSIHLLQRFGKSFHSRAHRLLRKFQKIRYETQAQPEWSLEKPLVSVIIPCYNYGKFLPGAIESVLNQTYQRFEILVINDGSTDEFTRQVLCDLRYEKTKVIHQENQGLAQTRNNGAAAAAGKYICFLDPDDFFEPTYLEKTLTILEADASLGSCYTWVQCFGDLDSIWQTEDLEPFFLKQYDTAPAQSVIRKKAWESVKGANGSGFLTKYNGFFEDWVFWIDMLCCGYRGQVIKEPLILYRVHQGSLSATHKSGFDKMLKVLHEDRRQFFFDRSYRKQLERKLNRRIYIDNPRINLDSPVLASTTPS